MCAAREGICQPVSGVSAGGPIACGSRVEESACTGTYQCACGLACISGYCLRPCEGAGTQGTCPPGHECSPPNSAGQSTCRALVGENEACLPAVCAPPLECIPTISDLRGYASTEVCHQTCIDDVECPWPDKCSPAAMDLVEFQAGDGGSVACALDDDCDTAQGFRCLLQADMKCARVPSACGQALAPADLRPPPDGGQPTVSYDDLCNVATSFLTAEGYTISGGRFCEDFSNLPNPPLSQCMALLGSAFPSTVGVCIAFCSGPLAATSPTGRFDCPAGCFCDEADARFYEPVSVNGATIPCSSDEPCLAHGARCVAFGAPYGTICAVPDGMCQPLQ